MKKVKIIVKPRSANFWWGIYGFCEKTGWEDLNLFYDNGERIGGICLNGKGYLRAGLDDLKNDPADKKLVEAIEKYLDDDKCHFWYYYDDKDDEDFFEVDYLAPKNNKGVKPRFMDIWHPDEGIGISTIETGVNAFAKKHLDKEAYEVEIQNVESFEESLKSFKENEEVLGGDSKVEIKFTDDLIEDLSQHWKKPKEEVLKKLENAIR